MHGFPHLHHLFARKKSLASLRRKNSQSTLQSESTEKYSLSRDHFSMNKFERLEQEDFQTVCEVVEKIVEQSPGLITLQRGNELFRVDGIVAGMELSIPILGRSLVHGLLDELLSGIFASFLHII